MMSPSIKIKLLAPIFISISAFSITHSVLAQIAPQEHSVTESQPGKVTRTNVIRASVVVTQIDKATRKLTLKRPTGSTFDVIAGNEVKNFDQIKVNDEVAIAYEKSLTLDLKKAGEASSSSSGVVAHAEPGDKPANVMAYSVTVVAQVIDVNPERKTITLQGEKGRVVELDVKNPDQFKVVKTGDQVEVTYTEAMAIAVEPTLKKATTK